MQAGFDIAFLDRHQELSPAKNNGPTWRREAICAGQTSRTNFTSVSATSPYRVEKCEAQRAPHSVATKRGVLAAAVYSAPVQRKSRQGSYFWSGSLPIAER